MNDTSENAKKTYLEIYEKIQKGRQAKASAHENDLSNLKLIITSERENAFDKELVELT